jgi:hypothetical protein
MHHHRTAAAVSRDGPSEGAGAKSRIELRIQTVVLCLSKSFDCENSLPQMLQAYGREPECERRCLVNVPEVEKLILH